MKHRVRKCFVVIDFQRDFHYDTYVVEDEITRWSHKSLYSVFSLMEITNKILQLSSENLYIGNQSMYTNYVRETSVT